PPVHPLSPYPTLFRSPFGSYSSFLQPMAHPLGANLKEVIGIARYQPLPRLMLKGVMSVTHVGRDDPGENWGSDILKPNNTRERRSEEHTSELQSRENL